MSSPVNDEVLGDLQWNTDLGQFETSVDIDGAAIPFRFEPYDRNAPDFTSARAHLTRIRSDASFFVSAAAEHMLKTHNESWNDGKPITGKQFCDRIELYSILVYEDPEYGSATLFYHDGGLFDGHSIVVEVSDAGKIQDVKLFG